MLHTAQAHWLRPSRTPRLCRPVLYHIAAPAVHPAWSDRHGRRYTRRAAAAPPPPAAAAAAATTPVTPEDRQYILQALELAKRALGQTHPNPAVGCVIVNNGKVVGEGYHPKAGMPHAEVYALRAAGNAAAGATAYVTLEPCNHYGRTPPCSQALVAAGVKRVVVGVVDPNPLVASAGIETLQQAGMEVSIMDGSERDSCYQINEEFMQRMVAEAQAAAVGGSR